MNHYSDVVVAPAVILAMQAMLFTLYMVGLIVVVTNWSHSHILMLDFLVSMTEGVESLLVCYLPAKTLSRFRVTEDLPRVIQARMVLCLWMTGASTELAVRHLL